MDTKLEPLTITLMLIRGAASPSGLSAAAFHLQFSLSRSAWFRHLREAAHLGAVVAPKGGRYYLVNREVLPRVDQWLKLQRFGLREVQADIEDNGNGGGPGWHIG